MAGPTDILTEDVKDLRESNRQLAAEFKGVFDRLSNELRDSNQRLTDAISGLGRDFNNFRVEVTKELATTRESLKGELATVNTSLREELTMTRESLKGELATVNTSLREELTTTRESLKGELATTREDHKEFRGRTETSFKVAVWGAVLAVATLLGGASTAGVVIWRAAHVDAEVTALREHAKEQDARIDKLIGLHNEREKPPLSPERPSQPMPQLGNPSGPTEPPKKTSGDNRPHAPISGSRVAAVVGLSIEPPSRPRHSVDVLHGGMRGLSFSPSDSIADEVYGVSPEDSSGDEGVGTIYSEGFGDALVILMRDSPDVWWAPDSCPKIHEFGLLRSSTDPPSQTPAERPSAP